MRIFKHLTLLILPLIAVVAIGQEDRRQRNASDTSSTAVFLPGPAANPGRYTDGPGRGFFRVLATAGTALYSPTTFDQLVEASTVIARGNLSEVVLGRSINSSDLSTISPPVNTIFLKIVPSNVLKGQREDYYLVELPASLEMFRELENDLYLGDIVILLSPASNWLASPEISLWPAARVEWLYERPLYQLTRPATLFTLTGSGRLASPLDVLPESYDLYTNINSLDELESHVATVQRGQQPVLDDQAEGSSGASEWGPTARVEREQGLVQYRYESGELQAEIVFRDGVPDGRARYWFENGQLALDAIFEDGQRGDCEAWTEDGSPTDCP